MRVPGLLVVAMLVAAIGCYQPQLSDCTVTCEAARDCADGQTCRAGYCTASDRDCATATVDAAPTPPPDDTCTRGCTNGTCRDGVCVIDCTAEGACAEEVTCPPNLPCRIECGRMACPAKLRCGLAASCTVVCAGDYSCKDEILCNTNRCDVTCSGAFACEKRARCQDACACDVRCTGESSCKELPECPADTCRLGDGCASTLPGCNTCS